MRDMFGIQNDEFVSDLDEFLTSAYSEHPDPGPFPDDLYRQLYGLLAGYGAFVAKEDDPSAYMFTGKRVDTDETVKGYLWNGASRAYIIPHNIGVDYDEGIQQMSAHAVEVEKDTIR